MTHNPLVEGSSPSGPTVFTALLQRLTDTVHWTFGSQKNQCDQKVTWIPVPGRQRARSLRHDPLGSEPLRQRRLFRKHKEHRTKDRGDRERGKS